MKIRFFGISISGIFFGDGDYLRDGRASCICLEDFLRFLRGFEKRQDLDLPNVVANAF